MVLIGGDLTSSFGSSYSLVPYSGTRTPATPTSLPSGSYTFDEVTADFRPKRYLDNATHTGLWSHTGVRQTASDFEEFQAHMLWDVRFPLQAFSTITSNKTGFQMIVTIGSKAQGYPSDVVQEYYWCPSVFVDTTTTHVDVGSKPPKLVSFDCVIRPNGPAFFLPTEGGIITAQFLPYLASRGWSF